MKNLLLILTALSAFGAELSQETPLPVVHKSRRVVVRAAHDTSWCAYSGFTLEPARYEPDQPKKGKPARTVTERELAAAQPFLARLDRELPAIFPASSEGGASPQRALVVSPTVRKLRTNRPWLNILSFPLLRGPIMNSNMRTELVLRDAQTGNTVGSVLLGGNSFLANQFDLRRYWFAFSRHGQAHSLARSQSRRAVRHLNTLMACSASSPEAPVTASLAPLPDSGPVPASGDRQ